jgi:dTDP-L-rhamnose 4-epimerase
MKVLVTGGSGFIGSHLVDELVGAGHAVVVVDRRPPPHPNTGAEYVLADIRQPEIWPAVLEGVDAVSHQAARVGLGVRFADVTDYVDDNDVGTAVLLAALDQADYSGRLVLASSMVVYGEGAYRCPGCGPVAAGPRTPERLAAGHFEPDCRYCGADLVPEQVTEDAPLDPRNTYAATKVHQEHLCNVFARSGGAVVTSLRYHNVYGPRCPVDTPYAGVASLFVAALRRGEAPRVFEDGGQRRDFIHVTDVARANVLALTSPREVSGSFNIASGNPRTIFELAAGLAAALDRHDLAPVVTGEWRLGDVRHITASPARATTALGFTASVPFTAGLAQLAGTTV